jgi:hypothetical protein
MVPFPSVGQGVALEMLFCMLLLFRGPYGSTSCNVYVTIVCNLCFISPMCYRKLHRVENTTDKIAAI